MEEERQKTGGTWGRLASLIIILAALAIAFEGGLLYRTGAQSPAPLVIRIPDYRPELAPDPRDLPSGLENASATLKAPAGVPETGACRFVGSRNSDLYHLPQCAAAKRIKPENRKCFASEEAARKAGYRAGCLK